MSIRLAQQPSLERVLLCDTPVPWSFGAKGSNAKTCDDGYTCSISADVKSKRKCINTTISDTTTATTTATTTTAATNTTTTTTAVTVTAVSNHG
eukprot:6821-Heterococcus_DN1.PRE.1